jgi:hypothetical protein
MFDVEGMEVESKTLGPVEGGREDIFIELSNHIKTKQNNVPRARVLPQSDRPVQPSGDPLTDWY